MSERDVAFLSNSHSFENKILSEGFKKGYESYKNSTMVKKTYIMGNDARFYKN